MTPELLAAAAYRILTVTPRVPQRQLDNVAAEVGMMLGELCTTETELTELSDELMRYPQRRWNFAALRHQAELIVSRRRRQSNPAAVVFPSPPLDPVLWFGRPVPEWAWSDWPRFQRETDAQAWATFQRLPTSLQRQLEADVRRELTEYQARNPRAPFNPITPEQLQNYLTITVLQMQERGELQ